MLRGRFTHTVTITTTCPPPRAALAAGGAACAVLAKYAEKHDIDHGIRTGSRVQSLAVDTVGPGTAGGPTAAIFTRRTLKSILVSVRR